MIQNMPLERQLETLATCGIHPNSGIGFPELLARYDEREYERSPFKLLLRVLGDETGEASGCFLSDNIWYLNTECIMAPGDYAGVALRMATLSGGALPIANVQDSIDPRGSVARLEFTLGEREIKWHAKLQGELDRPKPDEQLREPAG